MTTTNYVVSTMENVPGTSPIHFAVKASMLVRIHLDDGSGIVIDVPVKNFLQDSAETLPLAKSASFLKLHQCTLSALFSYHMARDPNFTIPLYALKYFETVVTYRQGDVLMAIKNDEDLSLALESGSLGHMFDDNDDIILHLFCKIRSSYVSELDQQINEIVSVTTLAIDRAFQALRNFAFKFRQNGKDDFPLKATCRAAVSFTSECLRHVLNNTEFSKGKEPTAYKQRLLLNRSETAVHDITVAVREKASKAVDAVTSFIRRVKDSFDEDDSSSIANVSLSPSLLNRVNKTDSSSSLESYPDVLTVENKTSSLVKQDENGIVEISFDHKETKTQEEWKVFFGSSAEEKSKTSSCSIYSNDQDCVVIAVDDEVISLDPSSVSNDGDVSDDFSIASEDDCNEAILEQGVLLMAMAPTACPSDEERSMDGVLISSDADVIPFDDASDGDSWAVLEEE